MGTSSDVNSIAGVQSYESMLASSQAPATGSAQSLGQDTFLKLLTTQLQHQDPLNPMDNTEFVAQLSQFSSLEQLTNVNTSLDSMAMGMGSLGSATMVNLIGKEVRAAGNGFEYSGSDKTLHFDLGSAAQNVTVTIYNDAGSVVRQVSVGGKTAGENSFTWDGKNTNGVAVPNGNYTFKVSGLNDSNPVPVTTYTQGLVSQLDFINGAAAPKIDGQTVTVDKIVRVIESPK